MLMKLTPGVNFTNLLALSANALVINIMRRQSFFGAIQFHQQSYGQLYQNIQLEVMPNFCAVCSVPYTSKLGVKLLAQKLLKKC